jgi:hypothetical protein
MAIRLTVTDLKFGSGGASFLGRLVGAKKLAVQLTDYEGHIRSEVVDATWSRDAIRNVADACKDPDACGTGY